MMNKQTMTEPPRRQFRLAFSLAGALLLSALPPLGCSDEPSVGVDGTTVGGPCSDSGDCDDESTCIQLPGRYL